MSQSDNRKIRRVILISLLAQLLVSSVTVFAADFDKRKVENVVVRQESGNPVAYVVLGGAAAVNGCGFVKLNLSQAFDQDQYGLILESISDGHSVSVDVDTKTAGCVVKGVELHSN